MERGGSVPPTPNADETFPIGCTATLPECAGAQPTEVQTCQCEPAPTIDGGTAPQWACPI